MKIIQMNLDEFGIYHNVEWNPPESGLVVLHGQNESGKTTLMKYVRSMFFGYHRGEWQGLSGHMEIRRQDGKEYGIYRKEKESYVTFGEQVLHEEPANLWWHGLDRKTYDKIFAMGLEDLQGFKILSNEQVRSHFFSVKGGESIGATRRDLAHFMGELLVASPQGKKPINLLLQEQKEYEDKIYGMSRQEDEFADLQAQEQETHEEENSLRLDIAEAKQQIEQISMPIAAWDVYRRGQDAQAQMRNLAEVAQFPADGARRWDDLMSKIKEMDQQIGQLRKNKDPHKNFLLPEWSRWIACSAQTEDLFQQVPNWKQMEEELRQAPEKEEAWASEIDQLQLKFSLWTDEPIHHRVDWEDGLTAAAALTRYTQEHEKWEAAQPKNTTTPPKKNIVGGTYRTEEEWQALDSTASAMQQTLVERDKVQEQIQWLEEGPNDTSQSLLWLGILLLAGAAALVAGMIFYDFDGTTGSLGAGICTFAALCAFYGQVSRNSKLPKRLEELRIHQEYLADQLKELSQKLSLDMPAQAGTKEWMDRLDALRKEYMDWRAMESKDEWDKQQRIMYDAIYRKWQSDGKVWTDKLKEAQKQWALWKQQSGFLRLSTTDVAEARKYWEQWKTVADAAEFWRQRKEQLKAELSRLRDRAEQLLHELAEPGKVTPAEIERIYHKWQDIRIKTEVAKEQERQQEQQAAQMEYWLKERETRNTQIQELLHDTGAQTEGEFRSKILKFRRFQQYKEIYEQSEAHLKLIAKTDKNLALLRKELKIHDMKTWKEELAHYKGKISEYEKKLAAVAERRGSIVERLSQMAKSDSYGKLLQQKQNRETVLDNKVDQWLSAMFAQHMIGQAQEYYERVRQPLVIRTAGDFLHKMTQGRYTLQASFDGKELYAVDVNQRRIPEKQWSSGLGDQIYLAIRISLAMAFAQQLEPLPLILDDILVRFDEKRQQEALRFLADLGKKEQIFLFTCSEETRRIAEEVQKLLAGETDTVHLFEIEQGTIRPAQ